MEKFPLIDTLRRSLEGRTVVVGDHAIVWQPRFREVAGIAILWYKSGRGVLITSISRKGIRRATDSCQPYSQKTNPAVRTRPALRFAQNPRFCLRPGANVID
jgi:hypothetical protein